MAPPGADGARPLPLLPELKLARQYSQLQETADALQKNQPLTRAILPTEAKTWRATRPGHLADEARPLKMLSFVADAKQDLAMSQTARRQEEEDLRDLRVGLKKLGPQESLTDYLAKKKKKKPSSLSSSSSKKKTKQVDEEGLIPSVFERQSPRAVATLRAFLREFLVDDSRGAVRIRQDIDLRRYQEEAKRPVTNATVMEICVMQPGMTSIDATRCELLTDACLISLARHCRRLRTAKLGGTRLTRVGVRALAVGCQAQLRTLSLARCPMADDDALAAIGSACPNLTALDITGCLAVSDEGLAVVAQGCRHLEVLDVAECPQVGEFGDRALLALGRHCAALRSLDILGCRHVHDPGIVAVSRGCPRLTKLRLSGCDAITGRAIDALALNCPRIADLSLAGCDKITDGDMCRLAGASSDADGDHDDEFCGHSGGLTRLVYLDISGCAIARAGLEAIARRCPRLEDLTLRRCASVDDGACDALRRHAHRLRTLDLGDCHKITEAGVGGIARGITGLAKLDVTGCKQVSRLFLLGLLKECLPYSDSAKDFVGFQTRPNANALRRADELFDLKTATCTRIQSIWRGAQTRVGLGAFRRRELVRRSVVRAQAAIRARTERKWVHAAVLARRQQAAAIRFQAAWRACRVRRACRDRAEWERVRRQTELAAVKCQVHYRRYQAKLRVLALRRAVYRVRVDDARDRARVELASIRVQALQRGCAARRVCDSIRARNLAVVVAEMRRQQATTLFANKWRQRVAKKELDRRVEAVRRERTEWAKIRILQRTLRGHVARQRVQRLRAANMSKVQIDAAVVMQAWWRASRACFFATIAAAMKSVQAQERAAALIIERNVRMRLGLLRARALRDARDSDLRRDRGALTVQRVFRGHEGRTRHVVLTRLSKLKNQAEPLYARLDVLETEGDEAEKARDAAAAALDAARREVADIAAELREVQRVAHPFWDTARIMGGTYPQRYNTAFLKLRLTEVFAQKRAHLAELTDRLAELTTATREKHRLVRQVKRELNPLSHGLAEKTRHQRIASIRNAVRAKERAARTIQARVRGTRLRQAWHSLLTDGADQWAPYLDETSGETYYFNDQTHESRWTRPLVLDIHIDRFRTIQPVEEGRAGPPPAALEYGAW